MKYLLLLFSLIFSSFSVQAKETSACDQECFQKKYQCNIEKSFTYNNCSEELLTCRARCKTEKTQNSSAATLQQEIAFTLL